MKERDMQEFALCSSNTKFVFYNIIKFSQSGLFMSCPNTTIWISWSYFLFGKKKIYLRLLIYCLVVILIIPIMLAKWPLLFSLQSVLAVAVVSTIIANVFLIAGHYQSHRTILREWIIVGITWIAWDGNAFLKGPWSQEVAYLSSHG